MNINGQHVRKDKKSQQGTYWSKIIDVNQPGDYGADPLGNEKFKMVPSGDIVDLKERNKRIMKGILK